MSASSPADLAVTFRSLARRRREAIGDAGSGSMSDLTAELDSHVAQAAAVMGTADDGESIAAAIEARRAEDWDAAALDDLRRQALDAGAVLRRITTRAESEDRDR